MGVAEIDEAVTMKAGNYEENIMRKLMLVLMLTCTAFNIANAQEVESIYGTYNVVFQPVHRQGELQSCSLIYYAVQPDFAYLNGRVVVANGNISFSIIKGMPALTMKVGIKEVLGDQKMIRPNFAYLQTANHSTATVNQQARNGDNGYRLYLYPLTDTTAMELFKEMVDSKKVTLAFNRNKGGVDVQVPIEFDVYETRVEGDRAERIRSEETMNNFSSCISTLTKQAHESIKQSEAKKK